MKEAAEKKQVYNPYLPTYEYVPDGEPHVFGDRVYIYGSHDRFDGEMFCLNDYICYSADVKDLTEWKYEGVIFRKDQDPRNQNPSEDNSIPRIYDVKSRFGNGLNPPGIHALWAPDVVKGPDGRYYLYYCLDFLVFQSAFFPPVHRSQFLLSVLLHQFPSEMPLCLQE